MTGVTKHLTKHLNALHALVAQCTPDSQPSQEVLNAIVNTAQMLQQITDPGGHIGTIKQQVDQLTTAVRQLQGAVTAPAVARPGTLQVGQRRT